MADKQEDGKVFNVIQNVRMHQNSLNGAEPSAEAEIEENAAQEAAVQETAAELNEIKSQAAPEENAQKEKSDLPPGDYLVLKNVSNANQKGNGRTLDNINIGIGSGEFVILRGPSGCGKSTLLRMIAGFENISSGEILLEGYNINNTPPDDRNISMIAQNYGIRDKENSKSRLSYGALSFDMSNYDNMAYDLKNKKVPKNIVDARVMEAAKLLDIDKLLKNKPQALSASQLCRVAIARAITRYPKLFLFDDILSGITGESRDNLLNELSDLRRSRKMTVIYTTSDQSNIFTDIADRVIDMK